MFSSYVFLNSCVHSVLCNLFWWQAFRMYDYIYYLHIYVLSMHGNIPWAGHLHFILHSLYVLQISLASVCIQSTWFDLCLAVLFSSFNCFFIRESFSLAFHTHTALWKKLSLFLTVTDFQFYLLQMLGCFLGWKTISGVCTALLWIRELNSCDYAAMIQERFRLLV